MTAQKTVGTTYQDHHFSYTTLHLNRLNFADLPNNPILEPKPSHELNAPFYQHKEKRIIYIITSTFHSMRLKKKYHNISSAHRNPLPLRLFPFLTVVKRQMTPWFARVNPSELKLLNLLCRELPLKAILLVE